jgi:hypothetical protein
MQAKLKAFLEHLSQEDAAEVREWLNSSPETVDEMVAIVTPIAEAEYTDADRIDFLEVYVNEHGALMLHTGDHIDGLKPAGLGLHPGDACRTMREAIDCAMGCGRKG